MKAYITAVEVAQNHLDCALTEDAIDKAIFEMGAAEKTLSLFFQEERRKDMMYRKKRKHKKRGIIERAKMFLLMFGVCVYITGCSGDNRTDQIDVLNKTCWIFDDIQIPIKEGYFYDSHEKFTVDDKTVAVTVYFVSENDDEWN